MTTAEDVKRVLRQYAADSFPGQWACGSVSLRLKTTDMKCETLVILPVDREQAPALPDDREQK